MINKTPFSPSKLLVLFLSIIITNSAYSNFEKKCYYLRNEVIEIDGKTCFSTAPVRKCMSDCSVIEYTQKVIDFICYTDMNSKPEKAALPVTLPINCKYNELDQKE
ncbi:hypothetical protein [Proteus mirabilis]|uniref:hypothetical protein n=1 Tax=Proteus mirabilis TaxID=584 RepID=UPI002348F04D|nr:hypothetical protein [Proteus mirabilis]MDC5887261.1 hypothetical protein [Proteus mirabilis]MDC5904858.1 hypothetical protein [Proteus mirabilis]MDC5908405.1 hypothetical protein [Proteus mirabilis]MDC5922512.1 hypothetical protein [Proteus mirabilis]MDC5933038.1 hypothetical protein [Proteus mirabilis]